MHTPCFIGFFENHLTLPADEFSDLEHTFSGTLQGLFHQTTTQPITHTQPIPTMRSFTILAASLLASSSNAFAPVTTTHTRSIALNAAASEEFYIDQDRRNLMNLILVGSAGLTIAGLGLPYVFFFYPPGAGGGGGGVTAKDALGADIFAKEYIESKRAGDHSLAQGLKGDATYIIIKDDKSIESYGLNAVCTHLGCVVPWSAPNNKFMCPCHGSQYAPDGHVVRGPAPLPLALAHCATSDDGRITFSTWSETDFRTEKKPWWM